MAIPSYGAKPLSVTFFGVRVMQVFCLAIILGMTGSFVNEMIMANFEPSKEIVGTLVITAIVALYSLISVAFYWSVAQIGLFIMAGIDFLILIAWIVVSVTVGRPVSYLNCFRTVNLSNSNASILSDIVNNINTSGSKLTLENWSGMNKGNCMQTKAIWGFAISLAVLFATSTLLLPTLHFKNKRVGGYQKHAV